jgi:lysozyme
VSSVQGEVDWRAVAAQHVSFAYIKATQGETYLDPYFADDWAGAKAAGLAYGAYEYFSFCSSGLAQAQAFLNTVPDDPTALPPVLDLELKGNCSTRPSTAVVAGQVKAFVDTVQAATGKTVISYVGWDFAGRYRDLALLRTHPHWSRRVKRPSARAAVIWQVYSPVPVDGVAGDVDLDITRLASLRALRA